MAKKSTGGKKKIPAADTAATGVDTDLAAQAAARALLARAAGVTPSAGGHSSVFKHLKDELARPHLSALDGVLERSAPAEQKKSTVAHAQQKQVGHNQTIGGGAARTGVPRRTAG